MLIWFFTLGLTAQASPKAFFVDLENFKNRTLSLQTEKHNLDASSDILTSRKLFWTPKLGISINQSQTRLNSDQETKPLSLDADLTLNLFRGGSDWNSLQAASAQEKAQILQVLNESLRIEIKAADLIFKSLYLAESQRIQEELLKLKEESLKIVTDRYRQGKIAKQEVTKSEVDLVQQKNKLSSARLEFIENQSEISSFFITQIETKLWPFSEISNPKFPTVTQIPLLEQKYWLSEAQEALWKSANGEHWPTLDFSMQFKNFSLQGSRDHQVAGLVSLNFPIWNRLETSARVSLAYAQYIGSLNEFNQAEQSLNQKSNFLKTKIEVSRISLSEAQKNVETSRKLYQDILLSFRLGRLSTNDLFLEQNRLLNSETALALCQLNFHQSLIETCALLGRKAEDCIP